MPIQNHDVYYEQDPRAPMTQLTLVFNGGGMQQEPENRTGLARCAAKMLFRGTESLSRETISRQFELLGAEVNAHVNETDFSISVSCFTKNLEAVMDLVLLLMNEASFPQQELDLMKKADLNQLEAALQDPERVLSATHQFILYDRRGLGKIGSRIAILEMTRGEIVDFFSNVRKTSVLYFTTISDAPQSAINQAVEPFILGRNTDGFSLKPETNFREAVGREAFIVQSKEAKNDRLIWSQPGLNATDDRRFDLSLVIDALGSFEGFLFDELRNKRGWCYGAYAFVTQATTRRGRIGYYADPSLESSRQLVPELLRLLKVFPDEKGFRERLEERNATFKNRYAYQLDLKYKLLSRVARDRYGIPILDRDSYSRRIDGVTASSARRVIEEVVQTERLSMVFYGDAERIQNILKATDGSLPIAVLEKEQLIA